MTSCARRIAETLARFTELEGLLAEVDAQREADEGQTDDPNA